MASFFGRLFGGGSKLQNAKANANTGTLKNALGQYITNLRKLKNNNPTGITRNQFINAYASNRNAVNKALQNYIMAVNKANFLNKKVNIILENPIAPETPVAEVVNQASKAVNEVNKTGNTLTKVVNGTKKLNEFLNGLNSQLANNTTNLSTLTNNLNRLTKNLTLNSNMQQRVNSARNKIRQKLQNKPGNAGPPPPTGISRKNALLTEAAKPNNKRLNLLQNLKNLNTNAKVNAAIKEIRGKTPNVNWSNTKANGLSNGQQKVLNGLKMGQNYVGLSRTKTANMNGNFGTANLFKQGN